MRKLAALVLAMICVSGLVGCGQKEDLKQGDYKMQYFFRAKVAEVHDEYLLLEVFDIGNTGLSEGAVVEVSTEVAWENDCPDFAADEFAGVYMERNADDNSSERLAALFISKIDETGKPIGS